MSKADHKNPQPHPDTGIEFAIASGRCEIWLREGGILASNSMDGFECWRYVDPSGGSTLPNITTTLMPHRLTLGLENPAISSFMYFH